MLEKYKHLVKKFYYQVTKDPTARPSADAIRAGGAFESGVHPALLARDVGVGFMGWEPEQTSVLVWMVAEDSQDVSCFKAFKEVEVTIEAVEINHP